jgi:hypothetical protein
VDERHRDEEAGEPVRVQPVLVRGAGERPDRPRPARGAQEGRERPRDQQQQAGEREVSERVAERRLVRVGRRGDERQVRDEQEDAGGGGAAMPHDRAVESAEGAFDGRAQGREHERARHEEDGLRSAQLAHEPAGRLTGRARDQPQDDISDRDGSERGRSDPRRLPRGPRFAMVLVEIGEAADTSMPDDVALSLRATVAG